jgi:type IV pilus assembly protein PilY1
VKNTCATGELYNYSTATAPNDVGPATLSNVANTAGILDYAPIPNAYKELTSFQIANESATTRGAATPIFYNLKITQDGLLSFAYSVSGGAYSYVIRNQSITASNGPLPTSFRVGFAGSDGSATNVHEILCFKAASANQSGSSATVNEKEAAKVEAGTQAYFAFYDPNDWTGTVTANNLIDTAGVISVSTTANWDASCLLTGTTSGAPSSGGGCATTNVSGPTSATPTPTNRIMLTWDTVNNVGIPFEWTNLNSAQQAALDFGDSTVNSSRLNYLRGDRSNEINSQGVGLYRARDTVLGDIVDSSPNWVGPPSLPYTATWRDRLYGTAMLENSGTQNYVQFTAAEQTRLNVVYLGSNDGFLHGFRAGSFDVNGNFVASSSATPNDGQEVLAYMPGSTLASAALPSATGGCTNDANTQTLVQGIHGVTPAVGATPECTEPVLDYANSQYGHNFFVDATPGSGDLFYSGQWHTWLVGGLGIGGAAIYALDVTDPSGSNFTEGNASSIVIGEWNSGSINCTNVANCGNNLGNTFGTPQIRRLHNGNWAVIYGNGFGSTSGDAGIFVMSIDSTSGTQTFYYLSTNTAGGNGIGYVTPADLDGDHITDYVYAGDLMGNVWRFDLTSSNPSNWAAAAAPLFTTQSGQPITTQLLVISSNISGGSPRLLIEFGTGQRTQLTNLAPVQYASGVQSLYGIWDWNLSAWNALASGAPYATLAPTATGLASPYTLTYANLQAQTLTVNSSNDGVVDGTNVAVCWADTTTCTTNTEFGWYANLPSSSEQIIFNPVFYQGAFVVNSTVPANNLATSCTSNLDTGYTYVLSVANGGVFSKAFPTFTKNGTLITDSIEAGVQTNATGSVYIVTTAEGTSNIVYQTISGTPGAQQVNIPSNTKAKRLTWIERR